MFCLEKKLKTNVNSLCALQCVVIGLQSTGEARTLEALEEGGGELNDFVSTAKYVLVEISGFAGLEAEKRCGISSQ